MGDAGISIVLYGVGSPVVVDVEESAMRAGLTIAAAVQNVPGDSLLLDARKLVHSSTLTDREYARPFLIPLFTPGHRQAASKEAFAAGFTTPFTLVDPTSIVARSCTLAGGVYVNSGCTIGAATRFDDFVFVNRGACIGHHVVLERFVSIGPGAVLGGQVKVGKGSLIGAGAVVLPEVHIGDNAVVGAGSVVTSDIPDRTLVLGNPARTARSDIAGHKNLSVD
jgi:sugar O-acyltransferase (sialic acid O-acetyltransferase NeuD family)